MTFLGKFLVVLNTAFCLLMATWAFAVYANRIDWSNKPPQGERLGGELYYRQARLKEVWEAFPAAETAWREARTNLLAQESRRKGDQDWYAAELQKLRDSDNPVKEVVLTSGLTVPDAANLNRPTLQDAQDRQSKPLQSFKFYARESAATLQKLTEESKRYEKAIDDAVKLTDQVIGPRGLQQRLLNEKAKRLNVALEQDLVRPLLINTVVDSELILKRQQALRERIKELEAVGVAATGGDGQP